MATHSPVFDRSGDIQPVGFGQQGIFHNETRHLSRLEMLFCGFRPLLLSSTIREDNVLFAIDLTNPDIQLDSGASLPRGTVHIYRSKFLTELVCYDQIALNNYSDTAIDVEVSFDFEADFADIFEVRGEKRKRRGEKLPSEIGRSSVTLAYDGLDHIRRTTRVVCSAPSCRAARRWHRGSASHRGAWRSEFHCQCHVRARGKRPHSRPQLQ